MSRPQMFLIAGVNGSGKSSFTKNITRKHPTLKIIDPDVIAKGITGSFATVEAEALRAGKTAVNMVQQYKLIASYRNGTLHRQNELPDFITPFI